MPNSEKESTPSSNEEVHGDHKVADISAGIESKVDQGDNFGVDEKALLRKLDLKLLPALTLLYLLSFLDRSNGNLDAEIYPRFIYVTESFYSRQCTG